MSFSNPDDPNENHREEITLGRDHARGATLLFNEAEGLFCCEWLGSPGRRHELVVFAIAGCLRPSDQTATVVKDEARWTGASPSKDCESRGTTQPHDVGSTAQFNCGEPSRRLAGVYEPFQSVSGGHDRTPRVEHRRTGASGERKDKCSYRQQKPSPSILPVWDTLHMTLHNLRECSRTRHRRRLLRGRPSSRQQTL